MIKASAGGGGKGMRIAYGKSPSENVLPKSRVFAALTIPVQHDIFAFVPPPAALECLCSGAIALPDFESGVPSTFSFPIVTEWRRLPFLGVERGEWLKRDNVFRCGARRRSGPA